MNKVDRKPEGESARLHQASAQKGPGTSQVIAAVRLVPPRTRKVTPCTYGSAQIRAQLSASLDSGMTLLCRVPATHCASLWFSNLTGEFSPFGRLDAICNANRTEEVLG